MNETDLQPPNNRIVHVCVACGAILAVHSNSNYREVKECLTGMKALCLECDSWPRSSTDRLSR